MLTINFQPRFVAAVENGIALRVDLPLPHPGVAPKTQTIRRYRQNPAHDPKPGDWRALYTGMRTQQCRKLGEIECLGVGEIELRIVRPRYYGLLIGTQEQAKIARRDGFSCWPEMLDFFRSTHGLPFSGLLIRW